MPSSFASNEANSSEKPNSSQNPCPNPDTFSLSHYSTSSLQEPQLPAPLWTVHCCLPCGRCFCPSSPYHCPKIASWRRAADQLYIALKVTEILWFTALPGWSEDSIPCPPTGTGAVTKPDRLKRSAVIYSPWSVAPGGPWITSQLPRNAEQEKRTEDQIVLCMWALHLHWKPPGHHKMGRG